MPKESHSSSVLRDGALPFQAIRDMIAGGIIVGADMKNVGAGSLDLTMDEEQYRVVGVFQPRFGERVRELLKDIDALPYHGTHFERGVTYIVKAKESLKLPPGIYAYCNPKSSTGRLDLHVRVIADGEPSYDAMSKGFKGELWFIINCNSFPVGIPPGETLSQVRFFNANTKFSETRMQISFPKFRLLWGPDGKSFEYEDLNISDRDGSLILTLDMAGDEIGLECRGSNTVLDFSARNHYDPSEFFQPVRKQKNNMITLKQGFFYLLRTAEWVRVPPELACEMRPMDPRRGDLRAHYAGFIDPGWGYGKDGEGKGRSLVLEVRAFESDLIFWAGRGIAKIRFEEMAAVPDVSYDARGGSHYTSNDHLLSKHFKKNG